MITCIPVGAGRRPRRLCTLFSTRFLPLEIGKNKSKQRSFGAGATLSILPLVICLTQTFSHACVGINCSVLRNYKWLTKSVIVSLMVPCYLDICTNSRASSCVRGFLTPSQAPAKPPSDPTAVFWARPTTRESTPSRTTRKRSNPPLTFKTIIYTLSLLLRFAKHIPRHEQWGVKELKDGIVGSWYEPGEAVPCCWYLS